MKWQVKKMHWNKIRAESNAAAMDNPSTKFVTVKDIAISIWKYESKKDNIKKIKSTLFFGCLCAWWCVYGEM